MFEKLLLKVKKSIGGKRLAILLFVILLIGWRVIATRPTEWELEVAEVRQGELVHKLCS